jgi:hypothetical protein
VAFFLQVMLHLIQLQDDSSPHRLWLLCVLLGEGADPGEHGLGRDAEEKRDTVRGQATQIEQYGVNLGGEGLATWSRTGKLLATLLTLFLGFASGGAMVDDPITLTFGACMQWSFLQRKWRYGPPEKYHQAPVNTPPLLA